MDTDNDTDSGTDNEKDTDNDTDTENDTFTETDMELKYFCYISIRRYSSYCIAPYGLPVTHHGANSNGVIIL
jgi:hypothetical protein